MRTSRQTELAEQFPMQVVCSWIGNSAAVARDHYLQVTDDHFARAGKMVPEVEAARKAARSASAGERTEAQSEKAPSPENHKNSGNCAPVRPSARTKKTTHWAVRDSNPRHPRCKHGALTN